MALKIGQVSRLFGIPIETLRYYDKEKILQPGRMDHNGYRLYDTWDIFNLTELAVYRGLGISLKEIRNILSIYSLEELEAALFKKYTELEERITYQHILSKYLYDLYERVGSAAYNIDNFWVSKDPRTYHVICSTGVTEQYTEFDCDNVKIQEFIRTSPFYRAEMVTSLENIEKKHNQIDWTFSINEEYFRLFDIAVTEEVIVMEPQLCVHTIIDMGEKGGLDIHSLSPILDYIRIREYEPTGMIRGEILARVHEKNDWHRFLEVKIPIIKN